LQGNPEIVTMAYNLSQLIYYMDRYPLLLTQPQADLIAFHGNMFLIGYADVAAESRIAQTNLWFVRPKLHYCAEMMLSCKTYLENPHKMSTIMEEDFMGKIKKIALRTHRAATTMRTVERYMMFLKEHWFLKRHTMI
jgi:hypothetical protein